MSGQRSGRRSATHRPWQSRLHQLIALVLTLAAAGAGTGVSAALVIRAAGSGGFLIGSSREVTAFLSDLREGRYSRAYDRVCHTATVPESRDGFVTRFAAAHDRGHGIASFQLRTTFADDSLSLTAAVGAVDFADGTSVSVLFNMGTEGASPCIDWGYDDLVG